MTWHQRFRGTATLGFLALALALLWRYVRPSVIGIGADEPLIPARFQGKYGFVSERGVVALPFEFDLTSLFDADGCCFVERNDEWFWIDRHGRKRSPASHDAPDDAPWVRTKRGSQWGWVDRQGRETLPFRWDEASEFDDHGWACVKSGDQWGWIDRRGRMALPQRWSAAWDFDAHGWAAVQRDGKWGWIDRQGREVLAMAWDLTGHFDDCDWVRVRRGGKWGWINRQGQEVLPFRWDDARDFEDPGRALVWTGDQVGLIDREGRIVIPPQWSFIVNTSQFCVAESNVHSWLEQPWFAALSETLGVAQWAPIQGGLSVVYDRQMREVWRSDFHAQRPALLPAAAFAAALSLLCGWRWRVARRNASRASL